MIKLNTSKTLFEHSLRDNGQDIMQDYTAAHNTRMAEKNRQHQGNNNVPVKDQGPKVLDN